MCNMIYRTLFADIYAQMHLCLHQAMHISEYVYFINTVKKISLVCFEDIAIGIMLLITLFFH